MREEQLVLGVPMAYIDGVEMDMTEKGKEDYTNRFVKQFMMVFVTIIFILWMTVLKR